MAAPLTFMATSSPVCSLPLYTCPRLAAATGCGDISANSSLPGAPSSSSIVAIAMSAGKEGSRSCSSDSTSMYSLGTRSGRDDSAWPILTKEGLQEAGEGRLAGDTHENQDTGIGLVNRACMKRDGPRWQLTLVETDTGVGRNII